MDDPSVREPTALLVAAHGERRSGARNETLLSHVGALRQRLRFSLIVAGVLSGEPSLESALEAVAATPFTRLVVYPFFMSDGYFVSHVLEPRLRAFAHKLNLVVLPPLGLDPRFAQFVVEESLATAYRAGFEPQRTHLLLIAHGSPRNDASSRVTARIAAAAGDSYRFASVGMAFLDQPPFLTNELAVRREPTIVAGLFSGEGRHGWRDVPSAIEETGANAVYTGPFGSLPGIVDIIAAAASPYST